MTEAMEPVLVSPQPSVTPTAEDDSQFTFEFTVANTAAETPMMSTEMDAEIELRRDTQVTDLHAPEQEEDMEDDYFKKSRERLARLKSLNYRLGNGNLSELEREPAYKRKNVRLDSVPHSSESNVSRYTLSNEEEKKPQIRSNNSFLHDNVD